MNNVLCVVFDVLHHIISSPLSLDVQFCCKGIKKIQIHEYLDIKMNFFFILLLFFHVFLISSFKVVIFNQFIDVTG